MPTEENEKNKIYFKDENGKLQKLKVVKDVDITLKENKELIDFISNDGSLEIDFKLKKYSKKRFKKLLMSKGIQRIEAEKYSVLAGKRNLRDDFGLICICLEIF